MTSTVSLKTDPSENQIKVFVKQEGVWSRTRLTNSGAYPVVVKEVLLAEVGPFALENRLYGEGFQMLAQYTGTVGSSACLTPYSDREHYRLPSTDGAATFYNLLHIETDSSEHALLAFSSCHRFSGEFRLHPDGICRIILNTEGITMEVGESWNLEEVGILRGPDAAALYDELAARIVKNHPPRDLSYSPTGWCSWYCFGPNLKEEDIYRNLSAIQERQLPLQHIQIDDGYEAKIGDWKTFAPGFPQGLGSLVDAIRHAGCEPAIWLAPFIAEKDSEILRIHPDWFIADGEGKPLASDQVSFGGWRACPWYCLDGTNPEVQKHLEDMSRFFREKYGCRYFKLDALFWGTMHGGRLHDSNSTRIEAYRKGMEAFNRGATADSFILGCNAPMWSSLGLVNGMRSTNDIFRSRESIQSLAREQFFRNWQHGKLWINDPDCVCLDEGERTFPTPAELRGQGASPATLAEFYFHVAVVLASGGMILSGDNISSLSLAKIELLKMLIAAPKIAARFKPFDFTDGSFVDESGCAWRVIFNWDDTPKQMNIEAPAAGQWRPVWKSELPDLTMTSTQSGDVILKIPARSAFALVASNGL